MDDIFVTELLQSFILKRNDVTESIYVNDVMGWQVPIHRGPVVSLRLNKRGIIFCSFSIHLSPFNLKISNTKNSMLLFKYRLINIFETVRIY